jgi:DNA repair exonuclease SbcCD ATPase subunit
LEAGLAGVSSKVMESSKKIEVLEQTVEATGTNQRKEPASPESSEKIDKVVVLELSACIDALRDKSEGIHDDISALREKDLQAQAFTRKLQDTENARLNSRIDKMNDHLSNYEARASELQSAQTTDKVDSSAVLRIHAHVDALQERLEGIQTDLSVLQQSDMEIRTSRSAQQQVLETEFAKTHSRIDLVMREAVDLSEASKAEWQKESQAHVDGILRVSGDIDSVRQNLERQFEGIFADIASTKSLAASSRKCKRHSLGG